MPERLNWFCTGMSLVLTTPSPRCRRARRCPDSSLTTGSATFEGDGRHVVPAPATEQEKAPNPSTPSPAAATGIGFADEPMMPSSEPAGAAVASSAQPWQPAAPPVPAVGGDWRSAVAPVGSGRRRCGDGRWRRPALAAAAVAADWRRSRCRRRGRRRNYRSGSWRRSRFSAVRPGRFHRRPAVPPQRGGSTFAATAGGESWRRLGCLLGLRLRVSHRLL